MDPALHRSGPVSCPYLIGGAEPGPGLIGGSGPNPGLIANLAVYALRAEADATPKPGLVDRANSGAHRDMDHALFLRSIDALAPFFYRFALEPLAGGGESGQDGSEPARLFSRLRRIGRQAERAMFEATAGVNTHQGLIFSLGLLTASAVCLSSPSGYPAPLRAEAVCAKAAGLARGIVRRDLGISAGRTAHSALVAPAPFIAASTPNDSTSPPSARGERLYRRYGMTGARGEAESGFRTVRIFGLPLMRRLQALNLRNPNRIHLTVLLSLMSSAADTNVVGRHGPETLATFKTKAAQALRLGGAFTSEGMRAIEALDRQFSARGISPGGAADLLAVTIFLHALEHLPTQHRGSQLQNMVARCVPVTPARFQAVVPERGRHKRSSSAMQSATAV